MIMITEIDQLASIIFFVVLGSSLVFLTYFGIYPDFLALIGYVLFAVAGIFAIDLAREKLLEHLDNSQSLTQHETQGVH